MRSYTVFLGNDADSEVNLSNITNFIEGMPAVPGGILSQRNPTPKNGSFGCTASAMKY